MLVKIDRDITSDLYKAYQSGDYKKFCVLIDAGSNINFIDETNDSLVNHIIINESNIIDNKKFFDKVVSSNEFINDIGVRLPLSLSLSSQSVDYASTLLKYNVDVDYCIKGRDSPIVTAFKTGDRDKIDLLLSYNPDLRSVRSLDGPILLNLFKNCPQLIDDYILILIEKGADPCQRNQSNESALHHLPIDCNHEKIIDIFLQHGFDINCVDDYGVTPLMSLSGTNSNIDGVRELIKKGAKVNMKDINGLSPVLHAGYYESSYDIIDVLDKNNADLSVHCNSGNNIAHYFSYFGRQIDSCEVDFLKKNKHLLSIKNKIGICPIDKLKKCHQNEYSKLFKFLNDEGIVI